ncbi:hypothetical protein DPMN_168411 [Dreissena polymorpha]|uniref:Uncharacterized protein n=1 Tax=Dreissena polymorpha TaxID=45954 RepID=A0A9D4F5I8_DREPO|nr:hypothetical protein DPMN_168411 [Dreissena polymorpha]
MIEPVLPWGETRVLTSLLTRKPVINSKVSVYFEVNNIRRRFRLDSLIQYEVANLEYNSNFHLVFIDKLVSYCAVAGKKSRRKPRLFDTVTTNLTRIRRDRALNPDAYVWSACTNRCPYGVCKSELINRYSQRLSDCWPLCGYTSALTCN